jgi:hypothetical protein
VTSLCLPQPSGLLLLLLLAGPKKSEKSTDESGRIL